MMQPLKMTGKIIGKMLSFDNPDLVKKYFTEHTGKEVDILIKKKSTSKTQNQLGYYWGHLVPEIAEAMGETNLEYVHFTLKRKFLTYWTKVSLDKVKNSQMYVRDLSNLNKSETAKFIDKVYYFGIEIGANIHPANIYWNGVNAKE